MDKARLQEMIRMAELTHRHINGSITEAEEQELNAWMNEDEQNRRLFDEMQDEDYRNNLLEEFSAGDSKAAWQLVTSTINEQYYKKKRSRLILVRSAAIIVILIGLGIAFKYIVFPKKIKDTGNLAVVQKEDVPPGTTKARLILANGNTVNLDSNSVATITQQNGVQVNRQNGTLTYSFSGQKSLAVQYNTVIIPRGGEYHITLEDGTRIWLNSASSLRFPTHFSGNERKVTLTGEAFFDVAHKPNEPFTVDVNGTAVKVLGTSFNIQAYPDEQGIKTTLVSGAVSVSSGGVKKVLKPGQMATVSEGTINISGVDTSNIIAWKNGLFRFRETALPELMKQLARWYDIDVAYADKYQMRTHFTGEISRNVPISKVLEMIEKTGVATFHIEGKTIKVNSGIAYPQHKKP